MLCTCTKLDGDPPRGWGGDPGSPPPYCWLRTQQWGDRYPNDWGLRVCLPP